MSHFVTAGKCDVSLPDIRLCDGNGRKAINIDYGNIDFENDIIESLRSTRL